METMENKPLITVLMTNYNCEKYLPESIASVLNQTYKEIQFVIIDDGSTDHSVDVIKSFRDDRIELYVSEENEHISAATNRGVKYAKGEYLAIMDSDDIWLEDKLEKQLAYLEQHRDMQGCFSWLSIIDEEGNDTTKKHKDIAELFAAHTDTQEEWLRFFFYIGNRLNNPSSLVEMKTVKEIGEHRYHLVQGHDFEWWIRFTKKYKFGIIEEPLTKYRRFDTVNQKNTSGDNKDSNMRFFNECVQIRSSFLDEIDDDLFIRTFGENFRNKNSHTKIELECEKAFLLCSSAYGAKGCSFLGMNRLAELLEREDTRQILKEKFSFTQKDFYAWNAAHFYYKDSDEKLEKQLKNELQKQKTEMESLVDSQREMLDLQQLHIGKLQAEADTIPSFKEHIQVLEALICKLNERIGNLETENVSIKEEREQKENTILQMEGSLSWKVTKPFRKLKQSFIKK